MITGSPIGDHRHLDVAAVEERLDDRVMVLRVDRGDRLATPAQSVASRTPQLADEALGLITQRSAERAGRPRSTGAPRR